MALLVGAIGCFQRSVQISPEGAAAARTWTASLATPPALQGAVQAQGTASMAPGAADGATVVEVQIENMAPGGRHPWSVRMGRCGSGGGDLLRVTDGDGLLRVSSDGTAEAQATLPETPVPRSGDYSVTVFASPENQDLVIACGNFAPPPAAYDSVPPGSRPRP